MYIPHQFSITDWQEITSFAASVRAADLVTVDTAGNPMATLMPFVWDQSDVSEGNYGKLVMHMARANPQWKSLTANPQGLAIVRGHQAYISPTNYERKQTDHKVVPTWNYQSVHLSGTVEISEDKELLRKIVTELTATHEASRVEPWAVSQADESYIELELKGIVALTLHVTRVEAKYKLSQNRSPSDQERVIADLSQSRIAGESEIAAQMKRLQP